VTHGIPGTDSSTHVGDLGNITPDNSGALVLDIFSDIDTQLILGRGLIVHAKADEGAAAQPVGNSGARLAQCVLGHADDFPLHRY
jgi:Cu/Zn superoxide dismutase